MSAFPTAGSFQVMRNSINPAPGQPIPGIANTMAQMQQAYARAGFTPSGQQQQQFPTNPALMNIVNPKFQPFGGQQGVPAPQAPTPGPDPYQQAIQAQSQTLDAQPVQGMEGFARSGSPGLPPMGYYPSPQQSGMTGTVSPQSTQVQSPMGQAIQQRNLRQPKPGQAPVK